MPTMRSSRDEEMAALHYRKMSSWFRPTETVGFTRRTPLISGSEPDTVMPVESTWKLEAVRYRTTVTYPQLVTHPW